MNSQEYKCFKIYAGTIKILMTESPLNKPHNSHVDPVTASFAQNAICGFTRHAFMYIGVTNGIKG